MFLKTIVIHCTYQFYSLLCSQWALKFNTLSNRPHTHIYRSLVQFFWFVTNFQRTMYNFLQFFHTLMPRVNSMSNNIHVQNEIAHWKWTYLFRMCTKTSLLEQTCYMSLNLINIIVTKIAQNISSNIKYNHYNNALKYCNISRCAVWLVCVWKD